VSALSLHSQLETSNGFPEIVTILQGGELECPDQPRPVAAVHHPRPGRAAPRLAAGPGSTERSAYGIVTGLTEPATWQSRKTAAATATRSRRTSAARTRQPGTCHRRRPGPARGHRRETAADRDRTGLRPPDPTRSSAMDPDHRRPSRAGHSPDEPRRPCHRRAQRRTRHRSRPCPASIPRIAPRCRQPARHRPVPSELP
jgi:hypothetical protein